MTRSYQSQATVSHELHDPVHGTIDYARPSAKARFGCAARGMSEAALALSAIRAGIGTGTASPGAHGQTRKFQPPIESPSGCVLVTASGSLAERLSVG